MDAKKKTVLAVLAGVVIGMTLFGGALASHALVRAVVSGGAMSRGPGMMDQRGGQYRAPESFGGCPSDGGCADGACPDTGRGMMDPRGGSPRGPQDGMGGCPDGGICPDITDEPTTES